MKRLFHQVKIYDYTSEREAKKDIEKMKEKKFKLVLVDEKNEIVGGYDKFEKREDLYIYLGLIINKSIFQITVIYLQFFDSEFHTFEKWVNYGLENINGLCEFTENNKKYKIKIKVN